MVSEYFHVTVGHNGNQAPPVSFRDAPQCRDLITLCENISITLYWNLNQGKQIDVLVVKHRIFIILSEKL